MKVRKKYNIMRELPKRTGGEKFIIVNIRGKDLWLKNRVLSHAFYQMESFIECVMRKA